MILRVRHWEYWAWAALAELVIHTPVAPPSNIRQAMAHRARAFGMQIAYHNRSRLPKELEGDAPCLSFDDLLTQSDVLSLNLSLNAKTRHIISAPEFAKMKDGVVLVNT